MEPPPPPAQPAPRRGRACLGCGLKLLGAALAIAILGVVAWFPFVEWLAKRADARARTNALALPEEPELPGPPVRDAGPLLEKLFTALTLTPAEGEALLREETWRKDPSLWTDPALDGGGDDPTLDGADHEPTGPTSQGKPEQYEVEDHRALVAGVLARLDAFTPLMDEALACDGWSVPSLPFDVRGSKPGFGRNDLRDLLAVRGLTRGGAALWADVIRSARLAAIVRHPSELGSLWLGAEVSILAYTIERALERAPLDDATSEQLQRLLTALDRDDLAVGLRADLERQLRDLTPDRSGFERLERVAKVSQQRLRAPFPIRYLAYLDDRARWVRLQVEAVHAVSASKDRAATRLRLEELRAEAKEAGDLAIVSNTFVPQASGVDRQAAARSWARLARMALAWAQAAGAGALLDRPPLVLEDLLALPAGPLRWRRDGERSLVLWSVGEDGVDHDADDDWEDEDGKQRDQVLRVRLP